MMIRIMAAVGLLLWFSTPARADWQSTSFEASMLAAKGAQLLGSSAVYDSTDKKIIEFTYWRWRGDFYRCRQINQFEQYCHKAVSPEQD